MPHAAVHVPVPVEPQSVVQLVGFSAQHANPSSHNVSQSSSRPLHVSAGAMHAPPVGRTHAAVQVPVPVEPQPVVQLVG
jgi:hypothetical protein